jgi:tetratricopeptide (TPR) repeat protein
MPRLVARASAWDGTRSAESAVDAYERVVAFDAGYAAAWNNLAAPAPRGYERAGSQKRWRGRQRCRAAFNLGSLQEDLGDFHAAITWYRLALEMQPDYADAHFNLAGVLGKLGRNESAARHWRRYLELDLGSPWAQIARSHLEDTGASVEDDE